MSATSMRSVLSARAARAARWLPLAGMLGALLLTGCQAARPHATAEMDIPAETNAELVEYISDQPYVTAELAYRAVFILAHNEIYQGDYADLTAAMKSDRLIGQSWDYDASTFLDRAAVGFLVARACGVHTGLNWQLFGLGRYAYRELIYRRIAHPSGEYGLVSGGEFLGVLARAEEYMRQTGAEPVQPAELGAEPAP